MVAEMSLWPDERSIPRRVRGCTQVWGLGLREGAGRVARKTGAEEDWSSGLERQWDEQCKCSREGLRGQRSDHSIREIPEDKCLPFRVLVLG